jgi:hypothetical protein
MSRARVSGTPPAISIRLPLEGRLQIRPEWLHDADEARLFDWLDGHPELGELLRHALEVLAEERAA